MITPRHFSPFPVKRQVVSSLRHFPLLIIANKPIGITDYFIIEMMVSRLSSSKNEAIALQIKLV
jgi:hypothetical protein